MSRWDSDQTDKAEQDRLDRERREQLERHNAQVENERAAAAARKAQLDKEEQERFQRQLEKERQQKTYEELLRMAEEIKKRGR